MAGLAIARIVKGPRAVRIRLVGKELAASGLFDAAWYLAQNPDVARSKIPPIEHYVAFGALEGRKPNAMFDSGWYLKSNPDVAALGFNPLLHYIRHGASERRDPHPDFDTGWYLDQNPDVARIGINPLAHFLEFGQAEGRTATYDQWFRRVGTLSVSDREVFRKAIVALPERPLISLIVPIADHDTDTIGAMIAMLRAQLYMNWELCFAVAQSTAGQLTHIVRRHAYADARIRLIHCGSVDPEQSSLNAAIERANGGYFALIDLGDELATTALFWIADEIGRAPDADVVFTDEDQIDRDGRHFNPHFKSGWNPALMLARDTVSRLCVFRREAVLNAGGLRAGFGSSQQYELVLRCSERILPACIRHVPRVLYHRRHAGSAAPADAVQAEQQWQSAARAIQEHLDRVGRFGTVRPALSQFHQVDYPLLEPVPRVSIVMPSGCKLNVLKPCLESLLGATSYPDFELLLLVNRIRYDVPEQRDYLNQIADHPRVRVCPYEDPGFNYSRVNNWGAGQANGSVLCFVNDDVELITPDWLERMVARVQLPDVAVVGTMLYYPDDTIQHAGALLGAGGIAAHQFVGLRRGSAGYFGRAGLEQDLSCVTAACMAIRRDLFRSLNGFDERLAVAFNDVDLCLRVRQAGWRVVWTPTVELYHHESVTLGAHSREREIEFQRECDLIREKWGDQLDDDPFYNPNLSLSSKLYSVAWPARVARLPGIADRGDA